MTSGKMKLGIFDSGLGGLIITKAIRDALPDIDILYLGDTLHLPYGNRSTEAITEYTRRAVKHLFDNDCTLVIIACNTASVASLRRLQHEWMPKHYTGRNILGVVVPTLEATTDAGHKNIGIIATNYIIGSGVYDEELRKINSEITLQTCATPLLVPMLEQGGEAWLTDVLASYLKSLKSPEALILGCTHYALLKRTAQDLLGESTKIISQDEIIPAKLADYLERHPEYSDQIGRNGTSQFWVTDLTDHYIEAAHTLYGAPITIEKTEISDES